MRVAIYVRVSTLEQAEEGYSIDEQIAKLTSYADAKAWHVSKVYKDGGFSGAKMDRPALKQMIQDSKRKKFDAVLVYKLDRLSRSQKDTLYLVEDVFAKNDVAFVSLNENFDTSTPFGKAMIGILAVFAQLEREQIKERMAMGMVGRAKSGKAMSWQNVPFGYILEGDHYVVDPLRSAVVKRIFSDYLSGKSINRIMAELNDEGAIGREVPWNYRRIRYILANPLYIGKMRYLDKLYDGSHTPLIDVKTFDEVQNQLSYRQKQTYETYNNPRPFQAKYMVSGMIRCGLCGAGMVLQQSAVRKDGTRIKRYKCYSTMAKKRNLTMWRNPNGCTAINHEMDDIERAVLSEVEKLRLDPTSILQGKDVPNVEEYVNEIDRLNKQLDKLVDLYLDGSFSKSTLDLRKDKLESSIKTLESKIDQAKSNSAELSPSVAIDELGRLTQPVSNLAYEEQVRIVKMLIKQVIVYDNQIDLIWRFNV